MAKTAHKKVALKAKKIEPIVYASGMSEKAVLQLIREAHENDRGTERYALWTPELTDEIREQLSTCPDFTSMKTKLNEIVVNELGGGYFGRGPFAL